MTKTALPLGLLFGFFFGIVAHKSYQDWQKRRADQSLRTWSIKNLIYKEVQGNHLEVRNQWLSFSQELIEQGIECKKMYVEALGDPLLISSAEAKIRIGCVDHSIPKQMKEEWRVEELKFSQAFVYSVRGDQSWGIPYEEAYSWAQKNKTYFTKPFFQLYEFNTKQAFTREFYFPIFEK